MTDSNQAPEPIRARTYPTSLRHSSLNTRLEHTRRPVVEAHPSQGGEMQLTLDSNTAGKSRIVEITLSRDQLTDLLVRAYGNPRQAAEAVTRTLSQAGQATLAAKLLYGVARKEADS